MEKIPKPELIRKVKVDETWDKSLCFFVVFFYPKTEAPNFSGSGPKWDGQGHRRRLSASLTISNAEAS